MKITCNLAAADRQFVTAQVAVQQRGKQGSVKHAPGAAALLAAARPALAAATAQPLRQCQACQACRQRGACQGSETLLTAAAPEGQAWWAERPPQGKHLCRAPTTCPIESNQRSGAAYRVVRGCTPQGITRCRACKSSMKGCPRICRLTLGKHAGVGAQQLPCCTADIAPAAETGSQPLCHAAADPSQISGWQPASSPWQVLMCSPALSGAAKAAAHLNCHRALLHSQQELIHV